MQNEILPDIQPGIGLHADVEGGSENDTDIAIDRMNEAILLREIQAILEQMSRHQQAIQNSD